MNGLLSGAGPAVAAGHRQAVIRYAG